MSYRVTLAGVSDVGRVRKRNEDSLLLTPPLGIAVLADGMGGHPGGDVASRVAVASASEFLERRVGELRSPSDASPESTAEALAGAMSEAVLLAHEAVRAEADLYPDLVGMGTTLAALVVDDASGGVTVGHVGDTRVYRLRGDALIPLTRDDTWVQTQVDAARLTPEQARRHPFGHVLTQCLGLEEAPHPHVFTGTATPGDAYLLCTDGLVGLVEDADILGTLRATLHGPETVETAVRALVEAAKENGGYDNVTVVLALVE